MQKITKLVALIATATLLTVYVGAAGLILCRFMGYQVVSVASGSMSPAINRGDALIVNKAKNRSWQIGQLVSFKMDTGQGEIITHRIVELSSGGLITKGDSNKLADHPIRTKQIYGAPVARLVYFGRALDLIKRPIGILVLIYLPTLFLIVFEIRRLVIQAGRTHYLLDYSYAKKRQKA